MQIFTLINTTDSSPLADACVLPDGQVAIAWKGKPLPYGAYNHGTYGSFGDFEAIQLRIPNRLIQDCKITDEQKLLGTYTCSFRLYQKEELTKVDKAEIIAVGLEAHTYSFRLQPEEDSSKGEREKIIAVGCIFNGTTCVLQWIGKINSTFWYPNLRTMTYFHGHDEKTRIEIDM